jgi:hypothetical protein
MTTKLTELGGRRSAFMTCTILAGSVAADQLAKGAHSNIGRKAIFKRVTA